MKRKNNIHPESEDAERNTEHTKSAGPRGLSHGLAKVVAADTSKAAASRRTPKSRQRADAKRTSGLGLRCGSAGSSLS
jgi:hypothetical protein